MFVVVVVGVLVFVLLFWVFGNWKLFVLNLCVWWSVWLKVWYLWMFVSVIDFFACFIVFSKCVLVILGIGFLVFLFCIVFGFIVVVCLVLILCWMFLWMVYLYARWYISVMFVSEKLFVNLVKILRLMLVVIGDFCKFVLKMFKWEGLFGSGMYMSWLRWFGCMRVESMMFGLFVALMINIVFFEFMLFIFVRSWFNMWLLVLLVLLVLLLCWLVMELSLLKKSMYGVFWRVLLKISRTLVLDLLNYMVKSFGFLILIKFVWYLFVIVLVRSVLL